MISSDCSIEDGSWKHLVQKWPRGYHHSDPGNIPCFQKGGHLCLRWLRTPGAFPATPKSSPLQKKYSLKRRSAIFHPDMEAAMIAALYLQRFTIYPVPSYFLLCFPLTEGSKSQRDLSIWWLLPLCRTTALY